jgi:molecular chaperone DnaK
MERILGIDLGTTNSCVAVLEDGNPMVVPMEDGRFVLPSVVAFLEDGRHVVGHAARRLGPTQPTHTVFVAKRIIGRKFVDPQTQVAMNAVPYRCVEGPSGDVRVEARGRTWAIQEISALILAELKRAAERHFNEAITKAVITVPAYFNDYQRQATKDAGQIAGLEVLRIINEPTAAALAHGFLHGEERRVAVYDLGGGTFDVSVLKMGGGVVEVVATAGDAFLGGRDFDNRIVESLLQAVLNQYGQDVRHQVEAMQRLRDAAEAAKIALSEAETTTVALPFLSVAPDGKPVHVELQLTRRMVEDLVRDLAEQAQKLFIDTIGAAHLQPTDIDELVLVGGMTRMPLVREGIEAAVGRPAATGVHPDLVVAVGAAIQAGTLREEVPRTVLKDVTPHNLGISTVAGMAETIIPKDTTVPTEVKKLFTTVRDGQESVSIVVFQGESRRMDDNQVLGQFNLDGLRPGPRGSVRIEVAFAISMDGIVSVSAKDMDTGTAQAIKISGSHSLAAADLKRMAAVHADQMQSSLQASAPDLG